MDEVAFALVPRGEDLGRWCTSEDTRMNQAGEADAGYVTRRAEDAFKVPDGLRTVVIRKLLEMIKDV